MNNEEKEPSEKRLCQIWENEKQKGTTVHSASSS